MKKLLLLALLVMVRVVGSGASAETAPIYVILWFDTEDYMLPASDDAALRVASLLTERKVPATFKVVGEKARTLQRRGRSDVIRALKKHVIAYHSDFHSVHPTPSEYLADCGLLDGIAEFVRREGDGAADVRRIFKVKTLACYGQPGSSWGAQAVAGLKQIGVAPHGVPCYVDEGTHIGLDEKPFWYTGALNVYHMGGNYTRMDLHDPAAVEPARKKVSAIAERLRTKGGGLISIFYHPCEWVHQQFWDGVNFARGANPPREEWKAPPQRTREETEGAFERFGQYVDHIKSIPGVKFITASDLPELYPDKAREQVTSEEVAELAHRILASTNGLNFQTVGQKSFSLADQFELLAQAGGIGPRKKETKFSVSAILGPDQACESSGLERLSATQFRDALADVREFVKTHHRVPARVFIGPDLVSPAKFLYAMAQARTPDTLFSGSFSLGPDRAILPERYVAKDTPDLFGGWIIHKDGFRAPKILEIARLQTWTLKPALLKSSGAIR
jgi:hypothetical protein